MNSQNHKQQITPPTPKTWHCDGLFSILPKIYQFLGRNYEKVLVPYMEIRVGINRWL